MSVLVSRDQLEGGQGPGGVTGVVAAGGAMFWCLASFKIPMVRSRRVASPRWPTGPGICARWV